MVSVMPIPRAMALVRAVFPVPRSPMRARISPFCSREPRSMPKVFVCSSFFNITVFIFLYSITSGAVRKQENAGDWTPPHFLFSSVFFCLLFLFLVFPCTISLPTANGVHFPELPDSRQLRFSFFVCRPYNFRCCNQDHPCSPLQ